MESRLFGVLGKVAGIGGIALGVFLLLFRGILQTKFLPQTGLSGDQAYHILIALLICTFGIAAIGIFAWIVSLNRTKVSGGVLALLVLLIAVVLIAAMKVGYASESPETQPSATSGQSNSPLAPVKKYFSEQLALHEQDTGVSHGITVRVGEIGQDNLGGFITASVGERDDAQAMGRWRKGTSAHPFDPHCEDLQVVLKDIALENHSPYSWDELRKMGPAAEQFIIRTATFVVSGRCEE